jgi:hypothetical protein
MLQGNEMKRISLVVCAAMIASMSGCAAYKIDKSVMPSPADVAAIREEITRVQKFQKAVYDVSTFAVDRCDLKIGREPFTLITLGHLEGNVSKEKIAAYYGAAGFDETWRVLWADDSSPLKLGDRVIKINGNGIENNKTGLGEYPLVKNFLQTSRARDAALEGTPFVVTLESGKDLVIPTRPACRTQVFSMPIFEGRNDNSFQISTALHGALVLPPSAIHAAKTTDEYRYLAGIAVYLSASSEAHNRRRGAGLMMGLGALVSIAAPVLYPVLSPAAVRSGNAIADGDMSVNSALFASKVVADMGGDPHAGIDLIHRLESRELKPPLIILSEEQKGLLRDYIEGLTKAGAPVSAATQVRAAGRGN